MINCKNCNYCITELDGDQNCSLTGECLLIQSYKYDERDRACQWYDDSLSIGKILWDGE